MIVVIRWVVGDVGGDHWVRKLSKLGLGVGILMRNSGKCDFFHDGDVDDWLEKNENFGDLEGSGCLGGSLG